MELYKNDIKAIGNTCYEKDGMLSIICNPDTCGIESILLRNILLEFGDYSITSEDDFMWDNGVCDWEINTNLPYDVYKTI